MITYAEVFDRAMEDNDYPALMSVETACEKDLDDSLNQYNQAIKTWEDVSEDARNNSAAGCSYEQDKAYLDMTRKYAIYLEKHILYSRFRGFYKTF